MYTHIAIGPIPHADHDNFLHNTFSKGWVAQAPILR